MTFCLKGDCMHGKGRQVTLKGRVYLGTFKNGKPEGSGEVTWSDGRYYRGPFVRGKPHGEGVLVTPEGRFSKVEMKEGTVVTYRLMPEETREDGSRYGTFSTALGEYRGWYKGNRLKGYKSHGRGRMEYSSGSIYRGGWKEGKIHGNGEMIWKNGARYTGQWKEGVRSGYGTYRWPGGSAYQGGWKDNRREGPGIYQSAEGEVHIGYWKGERFRTAPYDDEEEK